jgi:hypothetical protein
MSSHRDYDDDREWSWLRNDGLGLRLLHFEPVADSNDMFELVVSKSWSTRVCHIIPFISFLTTDNIISRLCPTAKTEVLLQAISTLNIPVFPMLGSIVDVRTTLLLWYDYHIRIRNMVAKVSSRRTARNCLLMQSKRSFALHQILRKLLCLVHHGR